MNLLPARLLELREHEGVSLFRFEALGRELLMIGLEPPRGVVAGMELRLGIKATHLILSRRLPEGMTLFNALPVRCHAIDRGELLASVALVCEGHALEAILPIPSLEKMGLEEGETLYALFQAAELSIVGMGDES